MAKYLFFLSLLFLSLPSTAFAGEAEDDFEACASYPDVPIHITPRFDVPIYNYSQPIAGIMALSTNAHHTIKESIALGVTVYEPIIEVRAPIVAVTMPDGQGCAYVKEVNVTVGYRNVMVYIANEFPQNSCSFHEVMTHEQKHITVNREILAEYAPRIEHDMADFLKLNGVMHQEDNDYAIKILQENLRNIATSVMNEVTEENMRRQDEVDSVAEYTRISNSCNGQIRATATSYRGQRPR